MDSTTAEQLRRERLREIARRVIAEHSKKGGARKAPLPSPPDTPEQRSSE